MDIGTGLLGTTKGADYSLDAGARDGYVARQLPLAGKEEGKQQAAVGGGELRIHRVQP